MAHHPCAGTCHELAGPVRRAVVDADDVPEGTARNFERLSSGTALSDAHNGLRAFSRRFATQVELAMADMAYVSELLRLIRRSGLPYAEHPSRSSTRAIPLKRVSARSLGQHRGRDLGPKALREARRMIVIKPLLIVCVLGLFVCSFRTAPGSACGRGSRSPPSRWRPSSIPD